MNKKMEIILKTKDLCKKFYQDKREIDVLKRINLDIEKHTIQSIVGPSGAGKSTLIHIMGVLDRPTSGEVIFEEKNISGQSDDNLAEWRNEKIGFVFQFHYLLPEFSALENVILPGMMNHKYGSKDGKTHIQERALGLLKEVGLENRVNHRPGELSGGEQQRVAVARALVNDPDLILADEPTGNLDKKTGNLVFGLLLRLARDKGKTFVIVTHNEELAEKTDSVVHLQDGKLVM